MAQIRQKVLDEVIRCIRLTKETLRLVLVLNDGMTLRVAERWRDGALVRYSYYWLDAENRRKLGLTLASI